MQLHRRDEKEKKKKKKEKKRKKNCFSISLSQLYMSVKYKKEKKMLTISHASHHFYCIRSKQLGQYLIIERIPWHLHLMRVFLQLLDWYPVEKKCHSLAD